MTDAPADPYRDICRSGPVALELAAFDQQRADALRRFWMFMLGGIVLAGLILWVAGARGQFAFGFIGAIIAFAVGTSLAFIPLGRAGNALKRPALEAIAGKSGLTYMADGFDPPVYDQARPALFGNWLSGQTFTDLFFGTDPDGKRYAVYEARLTRRSGKSTVVVFAGQVYAWQRRANAGGEIVIIPDRGIFNFFKPVSGMERVAFDDDAEFDRKFEVYAFEPAQARMLVDAALRRTLGELRQTGRVFGYVGTEDVLIAAAGRDRFEAGSLFRAVPGEDRVRHMADELAASVVTLESLKRALP